MNENHLLTECFCDTNLLETLVPPQSGYNHQKGCGTVAKVMQEKFEDMMAVGVIDKDRVPIAYLNEFFIVQDFGSFELYKHNERHHFFLLLKPVLERFIITVCEELNINLQDFNLPTNFEEFKDLSKRQKSKKDYRFTTLFVRILELRNNDFLKLQEIVEYFLLYKYQYNLQSIREINR